MVPRIASQKVGYGLPDQGPPVPALTATATRPGKLDKLRGDAIGAAAAVLLTIPVSMGYGLLALSVLGDAAVPQAILAGLYAPICGCIVAVLLGANTTMIYSPRSIVTFLLGSLLLHNFVQSSHPFLQRADTATLLVLAFVVVLVAGFFQLVFGLLKLGSFVKYVPAPVVSGFQNAAAILIFFSQSDTLLGFRQHVAIYSIPAHWTEIQPGALLVGVATCVLILNGSKLTRRVPPTILGLVGGMALYYLWVSFGLGSQVGPVIGAIPIAWPTPHYALDFLTLVRDPQFFEIVPTVVAGALSLAIIASLDAVLCARLVQNDSGNRVDSNRELVRLGAGNMVAACFGGIANGINLASSFANHRSGARTPLSVLLHGVAILVAIVAISPLIGILARVVIAGTLLSVAIQLFDRWTLQILKKLLRGEFAQLGSALLDLAVIVVVTVVAVAVNIVAAVAIGVVVTVVFFLFRMSTSVIRRTYCCDVVHSRKTRAPALMALLGLHGQRIQVIELEGPIFFGTAENLAVFIESALHNDVSYLVLDLKRVTEIDGTGTRVILQIHERMAGAGKYLLLSSFDEHPRVARFLQEMGVATALTRSRLFHDSDSATEWAEDHLLLAHAESGLTGLEFPFSKLDVFSGLSEREVDVVKTLLERRTYRRGEVVFREGDSGSQLYIIAKGTASVRMQLPGAGRTARLMTFSAGTVFGELALLDQEARSATVEADEELLCYVLSRSSFVVMTEQEPLIAIKVLANLARELAGRLRVANRTIFQLAT